MVHFRRQPLTPIATLFLLVGMVACGDSNVETIDRSQAAGGTEASLPAKEAAMESTGATDAVAGISWTVPSDWERGPERRMRIATYVIGSGPMEADCAVFYFGPGQGGEVQANIDRWIGQFVQPDGSESAEAAQIAAREVAGLRITTIDLSGTYTAFMGGPMSGRQEERPDYRMLGAIVEAPEGPVFFKLTGPANSVENAFDNFHQLVKSVKKS